MIKALRRIAAGPNSAGKVIAGLGSVVRTGRPEIQRDAADALGGFGPAAESAVPDLILAIEEAAREKHYQRHVAGFRGVGPDRTENEVGR